jgi:hypothetical protein
MGEVEASAERDTVVAAPVGPAETIETACEMLDKEALRLEGLPASGGAEAMARLFRAMQADWRGALDEHGVPSSSVDRAAATARAFLQVYPAWLG